jgi:hypothetical protein
MVVGRPTVVVWLVIRVLWLVIRVLWLAVAVVVVGVVRVVVVVVVVVAAWIGRKEALLSKLTLALSAFDCFGRWHELASQYASDRIGTQLKPLGQCLEIPHIRKLPTASVSIALLARLANMSYDIPRSVVFGLCSLCGSSTTSKQASRQADT